MPGRRYKELVTELVAMNGVTGYKIQVIGHQVYTGIQGTNFRGKVLGIRCSVKSGIPCKLKPVTGNVFIGHLPVILAKPTRKRLCSDDLHR